MVENIEGALDWDGIGAPSREGHWCKAAVVIGGSHTSLHPCFLNETLCLRRVLGCDEVFKPSL